MVIWKDLAGYEEHFKVSNIGEVYSKRTNKLLRFTLNENGYLCFTTVVDKITRNIRVHRAVAETFLGNKTDNGLVVNHIDGDKTNNRAENLEWVTSSENNLHAYRIGLRKPMKKESNPSCKLTQTQVDFIREVYKAYDKEYGARALGKRFGVNHSTISRIVSKNKW